jgi:hypothetical protein
MLFSILAVWDGRISLHSLQTRVSQKSLEHNLKMSLFISDRKANSRLLDTLNSSTSYTTTRTLKETPAEKVHIESEYSENFQEAEDDDYGGMLFYY